MKKHQNIEIPHDFKGLLIAYLGASFVYGPLLDFLRHFDLSDWFAFEGFGIEYMALFSSHICFFLFTFLAYYTCYLFYEKSKIGLLLCFPVVLFLPIAIRFLLEQKIFLWLFNFTNYRVDISFLAFYIDNTYFAVYYVPIGILYYFYVRGKVFQEEKIKNEKLKAAVELNHLRAQVNPHFLFNSLNNIYALAYDQSPKILPAIEGLSDLLRYALYEKSERVSFEKEWKMVERLIDLEKMRLSPSAHITINKEEGIGEIMIPPLLLLPLVENLFKHGDLTDPNQPCVISINSDENYFIFKMENKIKAHAQKDSVSGIGIANITKRLEHYYDDQGSLDIEKNGEMFCVTLKIQTR